MWTMNRSLYAKVTILWGVLGVASSLLRGGLQETAHPLLMRVGQVAFWPIWRLIVELASQPDISESAHLYWLHRVASLVVFGLVWAALVTGVVVAVQNAIHRARHGSCLLPPTTARAPRHAIGRRSPPRTAAACGRGSRSPTSRSPRQATRRPTPDTGAQRSRGRPRRSGRR